MEARIEASDSLWGTLQVRESRPTILNSMKVFPVQSSIPDEAAMALRAGEIICYPTETFYALGIDPFNETAREKLYRTKGRSAEKELPLIASDEEMVAKFCDTNDPRLKKLAARFWPGPLTIVLPSKDGVRNYAIRISSHPIARSLAKSFGGPIVSTSANASGSSPVQDPRNLLDSIQKNVGLLLDAGLCPGGFPSTIISLLEKPGRILREGAIHTREIVSLL
jgi:L-threonylcarbamoyladenylate synthase